MDINDEIAPLRDYDRATRWLGRVNESTPRDIIKFIFELYNNVIRMNSKEEKEQLTVYMYDNLPLDKYPEFWI